VPAHGRHDDGVREPLLRADPDATAAAAAPLMAGDRAAVTAMVVATLLWGATFVVIRDTVATLDPRVLVCVRFTIAAVLLFALAAARGRMPRGEAWVGGIVSGILGAFGFLFQAIGLTATS